MFSILNNSLNLILVSLYIMILYWKKQHKNIVRSEGQ